MALNTVPAAAPAVGSTTEAITATPSGTQATGVQLVSRYNRVSVCATNADSVVLPKMVTDMSIFVANDGAASLAVFPTVGETIAPSALNALFSIPLAKFAEFRGTGTAGKWFVILSA